MSFLNRRIELTSIKRENVANVPHGANRCWQRRRACAKYPPALNREGERMRFRRFATSFVSAVAIALAAIVIAPAGAFAQAPGKPMTTASGLEIIDTKVGTGASPKPGQTCVMHYTGWLYENGQKGKKFDSSVDRNEPFEFPIGQHKVIAGWDEGVATMKVGGKRTLIIPPALGYGARGAGGVIPPNATLMFDVELLAVK
jgi:peptidylprolyl isomerase